MKKIIISIIVIGLLLTTSIVSVNAVTCNPYIYVDDDADPDWYDETHVKTIKKGIAVAEDGDTVFVFSGTYNEAVFIHKSINLIGEARDSTIIKKSVDIYDHHVTVKGFTMRGISAALMSDCTFSENKVENVSSSTDWVAAIRAGSHCNIIGNMVTNVGGSNNWAWGISARSHCNIIGNTVTNVSGGEFGYSMAIEAKSDCNIAGNTITDINGFRAIGIYLRGDSFNTTIVENDISDISGYSADGIYITMAGTMTITGNTISNCGYSCIYLAFSQFNTIKENTIIGKWPNDYNLGITLGDSVTHTTISENTIVNNSRGIYLSRECRNNIVSKNTITNNGEGIGIGRGESFAGYASNNEIIGNNITDTTWYGICCEGGSLNNHIYYNNFINNGNSDGGGNAYDVGVVNTWYKFKLFGKSMGNYWDDYTGQDNDGDGIGDTPYKIPGKIIPSKDWYPVMDPFDIENIDIAILEMTEEMTSEESEYITQEQLNSEYNAEIFASAGIYNIIDPSSSPTSR